ncbi:unnamed protein product [Cochlearia groenlandica]
MVTSLELYTLLVTSLVSADADSRKADLSRLVEPKTLNPCVRASPRVCNYQFNHKACLAGLLVLNVENN